jgi:ATP-dependent exoDNAse (exonuclease V) beta subunit
MHREDPDLRVGVLLRSNAGVGRMLYELGPMGQGVPAAGRGGGAMRDTAAVEAVLDLLRLADHPDHTAAAFNVSRGPLGPVVGLERARQRNRAERHAVARRIRRALLEEGYGAAVQSWVAAILPQADRREATRLAQLVELADLHDRQATLRPMDFVDRVTNLRIDDPATAPIEVLNIHQSKGLEWDVVVLPDLDWTMGKTDRTAAAFQRPHVAAPAARVVRWMHEHERRIMHPEVAAIFDAHKTRVVRDDLCLLYVAMTRARRGLHMIIDPQGAAAARPPLTPAGVLRSTLAGAAPPGPEGVLFRCGSPDWCRTARAAATAPAAAAPQDVAVLLRLGPPRGRPRGAATRAATRPLKMEQALRLPDAEAADRGVAAHKVLEQVAWIEDFTPDRAALIRSVGHVLPRRGGAWIERTLDDVLRMLQAPAIRTALARGGRDPGTLDAQREVPYARLHQGRIHAGRIDRLVIELEQGVARAATVFDFKTDALAPLFAEGEAERHRAQLEEYRAAAAEALGLDPRRIGLRVVFLAAGVVSTLE